MYRLVTDVEDDNVQRPENPRRNANLLEIITFSWLLNLFKTGRKKDLEETDLYTTLNDHKSSALGDELEKTWKLEIISASEAHREPSLPRALIKTFGTKFMLHGFIQLFNDITFKILQPLFIGGLLEHFNTNDTDGSDMRYARICACGLMLSLVVALILQHSNQVEVLHCGMKMRIACCSIIYRKVLCLSHSALGETSVGRVINLLANDVHQFDMAVVFINYVWIGPLQTAVVTYFLWQEIGLSSLIGLAAMILLIPFQGWLGKKISKQRSKIAKKTDTRVRLMNEIISGIQLIKMYAWEAPFAKLIEYARNEEIRYLRHSSIVKVILGLFPLLQTRYLLFTVLTSYALLGNAVSAKKIFVLVSFYDLLTRSMSSLFVRGITSISVLLVSIKRIQNFLLLEEKSTETSRITSDLKKRDIAVDESTHHNDETSESNINSEKCIENCSNSVGVLVTNVTASWTGAKTNNSLENINLTVETGRLVAITGPVGAGKSSLLQAILRELPLSEGRISVNGVISYASQETWLFSGSIQQNILFDSPMDKERYRQVIHVCALRSDFEQFPNGDKTFVGERGVTLSGGQRARINLARAVYKQADVYLLDDPLSAVDTRVGKHLFETCITGFLKGKTCILITHQIQYLTNVDKIVVMKNATIAVEGSYQEVQASGIDFAKSLKSPLRKKSESDIDVIDEDHETSSLANSNENISSPVDEPLTETAADADEGRETRSFGHIKKNVYMSYLLSGGITFKVLLMILMFILIQVLASGLDLWISYWVVHEEMILSGNKSVPNDNGTLSAYDSAETTNVLLNFREFFFSVYIAITVSSIIVLVICCVVFVSVCTSSSMHLHNKMFSAIIQATMYFLNTNSSGTVLNRFSKDIGTIDEVLPSVLLECLRICLCILGIVFVIGSVNIYFTIPTVVVGLIIYRFVCFYLKTSRSLKRLEGIKQSSIFSHTSESIQGLATIRAYGAERFLSVEFGKHQDLHSSVWYLFIASNHAFGFWLDIFCTTYQSVVLFTLFLISNNVYGGIVGLAITQTIQLTGLLQWAIRQMAVLENQIVSVERIIEYINCPQEATLQRSSPPCNENKE